MILQAINIKTRLLHAGLSQRNLMELLKKRGFSNLSDSSLSSIIHGRWEGKTAESVLSTIDIILSERGV